MEDNLLPQGRIIQESVPGKQITMAHIIASPVRKVSACLGLEDVGAIGILTLTPSESAIIAGDIAAKAANVEVGFLDRFTGALLITGEVASVEIAISAVKETLSQLLGLTPAKITRT